jgi:hypothetical protein
MVKFAKACLITIFALYLFPSLVAAGLWLGGEHPSSWRDAKWTSARLLPDANASHEAAIYVLSARTGGLKGAIASHSWIVLKDKGAANYERFDKVGWGSPIRRNGYVADAFWYSNQPSLVAMVKGAEAEALIPKVRQVIDAYPFAKSGGYTIYPGPNSNTFIAHVLRHVPEIGAVLPPEATGRDYLSDGGFFYAAPDGRDFSLSLNGYAGISIGARSGFEVNFMGLVAGIDVQNPGVKVPALGYFGTASFQSAPQL